VRLGTRLKSIVGETRVEGAYIQQRGSADEELLPVQGAFIFLQGAKPITNYLMGQLDTTETGCLLVNREMQTSLPGVFAVGDLICERIKQAVIAAADGAIAAIAVDKYIRGRDRLQADWS
jgi:thioredoxin reductase (NADPH)